jgi:hypothetical protein
MIILDLLLDEQDIHVLVRFVSNMRLKSSVFAAFGKDRKKLTPSTCTLDCFL